MQPAYGESRKRMRKIIKKLGDRRASNIGASSFERRVTPRELELLGRLLSSEPKA
jgi:hypothetical protein